MDYLNEVKEDVGKKGERPKENSLKEEAERSLNPRSPPPPVARDKPVPGRRDGGKCFQSPCLFHRSLRAMERSIGLQTDAKAEGARW